MQQRFAANPERAELIARARRFKAGWVELAQELSACQREQRYTAWGYASFEEYFRKELRLKTMTVNKLVGSYSFLKKARPEVLERDGIENEFPSLPSIDFLRRTEEAREVGAVSEDLAAEVRRAALDDTLPIGKLARQFGEVVFPTDAEVEKRKRERRAMRLISQTLGALDDLQDSVPDWALGSARGALQALLAEEFKEPSTATAGDTQ